MRPALQGAEAMTPGVLELVDRLKNDFSELQATEDTFALDQRFLGTMSWWISVNGVKRRSALGLEQLRSQNDRLFLAWTNWPTILQCRSRDAAGPCPQPRPVGRVQHGSAAMYEFTRDQPIDWRHPQAHALYWARKGTLMAEHRMRPDDIYNLINDRMQIQALWDRPARMRSTSIHSPSDPRRFPELRFIGDHRWHVR